MQVGARRIKDEIIPNVLRGRIGYFHLYSIKTKRGLRLQIKYTEQPPSITLEDRHHRQTISNFLIEIASAYDNKKLIYCDILKNEGDNKYLVSFSKKKGRRR